MRPAIPILVALVLAACSGPESSSEATPNQIAGTWRMVSATVEKDGTTHLPYGTRPNGMLVFTRDMHFVEVLTDGDTPRFASDARGGGTDVENRRAMASSIGFFGRYTVDAQGRFTGNRVDGATFPNWVGSVRTERDLRLEVVGNSIFETFTRPDGGRVTAEFTRVH